MDFILSTNPVLIVIAHHAKPLMFRYFHNSTKMEGLNKKKTPHRKHLFGKKKNAETLDVVGTAWRGS